MEHSDPVTGQKESRPSSADRYVMIALIGGAVIVVCCLLALVALWLGRTQVIDTVISFIASPTLTATMTDTPLPPTDTQIPTTTEIPATDTPIPSPTLSPTPNRFPTREIMSLVTGPPVMKEEFVDNSKNWTALGTSSDFIIQDGLLWLRSTETGQPGAAFCTGECGPFKDQYYYQGEVVEEKPSNIGMGLMFAWDPTTQRAYVFKIRPSTGEYSLYKLANQKWTPLVDWTPSSAILPNPQPNLIGVSYQEGTITPYINGVSQGGFLDKAPLKEGRIGLLVDQDGGRMQAGYLSVYTLFPVTPTPIGFIPSVTPTFAALPTLTPTEFGAPTATVFVPSLATPTLSQPQFPTPTPIGQAPATPAGGTVPPPLPPTPTLAPQVPPTATALRFSPTPTRTGACPATVPSGVWVLVIMNSSPNKSSVSINGVNQKVQIGPNYFYLPLGHSNVVVLGNKTINYEAIYECKIVQAKMK